MAIYRVVSEGVEIEGEAKPLNMSVTLTPEQAAPYLEAKQIEFVKENAEDPEPPVAPTGTTGSEEPKEKITANNELPEPIAQSPKFGEAPVPGQQAQPTDDGKWKHDMSEKPQKMQRA